MLFSNTIFTSETPLNLCIRDRVATPKTLSLERKCPSSHLRKISPEYTAGNKCKQRKLPSLMTLVGTKFDIS